MSQTSDDSWRRLSSSTVPTSVIKGSRSQAMKRACDSLQAKDHRKDGDDHLVAMPTRNVPFGGARFTIYAAAFRLPSGRRPSDGAEATSAGGLLLTDLMVKPPRRTPRRTAVPVTTVDRHIVQWFLHPSETELRTSRACQHVTNSPYTTPAAALKCPTSRRPEAAQRGYAWSVALGSTRSACSIR
ncbi:MAG: hypothetical protein ACJAV2_000571 [Myxococcota bacterium]